MVVNIYHKSSQGRGGVKKSHKSWLQKSKIASRDRNEPQMERSKIDLKNQRVRLIYMVLLEFKLGCLPVMVDSTALVSGLLL